MGKILSVEINAQKYIGREIILVAHERIHTGKKSLFVINALKYLSTEETILLKNISLVINALNHLSDVVNSYWRETFPMSLMP